MRKILAILVVTLCLILGRSSLEAWSGGGHMIVAYIAYQQLEPTTVRPRVDALLKLNPMYATWTKGVPANQKGLTAFVHAATWPDCIKQTACAPGYDPEKGDKLPGTVHDDQNIGYKDKLMHKYWHFVDTPLEAGAKGQPPQKVNAETEIDKFTTAIATKNDPAVTDNVKSYDVVWLEHLVGDVHQPLHATTRFTKNHPNGDAGGNLIFICAATLCSDELHGYWDMLFGSGPTMATVAKTGTALIAAGKPSGADNAMPAIWVANSFGLASTAVYVTPIGPDNNPSVKFSPVPGAAYKTNALSVANKQATLAGYRLAALLNANLK